MPNALSAYKKAILSGCLGALPLLAPAQPASLAPQGGEYAIAGRLPGDQVLPQVKINASGGYIVWQDNFTDGDGLGISARRLDISLSPTLSSFRVNEKGVGDQENPQLALLKDGGAVFVWQGGPYGFQHIYARFMGANGTFLTEELTVNTFAANQQINPAVAVLADGSVVVVWASYGQDDANNPNATQRGLQGIFGQRFSSIGEKLGSEFQVNGTVKYNQRTPAVSTLSGGGFLVQWITERYKGSEFNRDINGRIDPNAGVDNYSIDVFGRVFSSDGIATGDEFQINTSANVCANPSSSPTPDGGFFAVWSERVAQVVMLDAAETSDGWDIRGRYFRADGTPADVDTRVNAYTLGNQFGPKPVALGSDQLVVWTSRRQDGDSDGIFARVMSASGSPSGDEFRVNTTIISQQIHPSVAFDGNRRALILWTSISAGTGFDLFAQRYSSAQPVSAPSAPSVSALSQSRLSITWPELLGFEVSEYRLFIDDRIDPVVLTENMYVLSQLPAGTTHSFKLAYKLNDGRVSPVSQPSSGTTWGEDGNFDGLPDDWQTIHWGPGPANWPSAATDSDSDGATNLQEFLAGTNPTNQADVLRTAILTTEQGWRLRWNTQPGFVYQVQHSTDANAWSNIGGPRFAVSGSDALPIDAVDQLSFYRVIRIR
jgi:hypothetical protein